MNDSNIVTEIERAVKALGLELEQTRHGGSFCTVHISAPASVAKPEQAALLRQCKEALVAAGVTTTIELTRYDNPPYKSQATGKMEQGHPRHGDPLLIIDSVWWDRQTA
jgi:hypothetical protein